MPGRKLNPSISYRYSINGQEKEKEISENITSAEFWFYDSRSGRRWNLDPIFQFSPYSTFGNNPILYSDRAGLDTVKNWKDAGKGDIWGNVRGNSTFWYQYDGEKWNSNGSTEINSLENVVLTSKATKKSINSRFSVAVATLASRKESIASVEALLEGSGAKLAEAQLSKLRFLGPAAMIATLPFTLSSDNMSQPERMKWADETMNEMLEKGDLAGLQTYVENWNRQPRNSQNKIVFRYMSLGEYENRISPDDQLSVAPPFDRNHNLAVKYITPNLFLSSTRAKSLLALPTAPDIAIWTFEVEILATKMPSGPGAYQTVKPKYGEIGGGKEATILQPFPIHGFFPLIN